MQGWIKDHRKITEWEHYNDIYTYKLFKHLLYIANIKDVKYMGFLVPRGSLIIKESKIGDECGLSYQEVRTSLKKLLKSKEITKKTTNKFTVINIVNYSIYQDEDSQEQRTTNEQLTNNQRTINEPSASIEEESNNIDIAEAISPEPLRARYTDEQLKIIDEFFKILKFTRRGGKIADSVIFKIYESWDKHSVQKVIYALHKYIHSPGLHDKKENYVLAIISNATSAEIEAYRKGLNEPQKPKTTSTYKNRFINYEGREWDYDEIERLEMELFQTQNDGKEAGHE